MVWLGFEPESLFAETHDFSTQPRHPTICNECALLAEPQEVFSNLLCRQPCFVLRMAYSQRSNSLANCTSKTKLFLYVPDDWGHRVKELGGHERG